MSHKAACKGGFVVFSRQHTFARQQCAQLKGGFFASQLQVETYAIPVTVDMFKDEMAQALKAYELYVVSIDKTPEEFQASLVSLLIKAIKAFESRGPHLRHGIALDKCVTVILSQNDDRRPLCGIYFNLHSPYQKQASQKKERPLTEAIGEGRQES